MKRAASVFITAMVLFATLTLAPGCGGGGGDSGGISITRDMLVGTWVMSTTGGQPCTGCLVIRLNANGSGMATDYYGYWFGRPGTAKGTWEYAGGKLYLRTTGYYEVTLVSMPSINELHLSDGSNTNVYVRGQ